MQAGHLNFLTDSTPRMTISSAGLVGINAPNPTERLEVNGNIRANGKILVAADDTVYDLLAIILQLQNELAELKQQLLSMTKN